MGERSVGCSSTLSNNHTVKCPAAFTRLASTRFTDTLLFLFERGRRGFGWVLSTAGLHLWRCQLCHARPGGTYLGNVVEGIPIPGTIILNGGGVSQVDELPRRLETLAKLLVELRSPRSVSSPDHRRRVHTALVT